MLWPISNMSLSGRLATIHRVSAIVPLLARHEGVMQQRITLDGSTLSGPEFHAERGGSHARIGVILIPLWITGSQTGSQSACESVAEGLALAA